jgi:hypothetical protein
VRLAGADAGPCQRPGHDRGIIELKKIRAWMEAAGYCGAAEVEIFSHD